MKLSPSWNPHPYLVAAARRVWRWSPERRACLSSGERGVKANRERQCEKCLKWHPFKLVVADHIDPVGKQPTTWADYAVYYPRMFCPRSNLQRLCKECHGAKTKAERKARKKAA
jgi:5-methylcytosine-specific restriction endonuclease McrA